MTVAETPQISLDLEGPAAPPRLNGELVFDEPWQGRSFAMAMSLATEGYFTWDEFRDHLIAAVERWEADPTPPYHYYERWQEALESIVAGIGVVDESAVIDKATAYALRPAGHDHRHRHHHHDPDDGHGHHGHGHHGHGGHDHRHHDHGHADDSGVGHDHVEHGDR